MNIYLKALLTGKLMPTGKYEPIAEKSPNDGKHYKEVGDSKELKEFQTLDYLVKSESFIKNQANRVRLKKLEKNGKVKKYLKALADNEQSEKLQAMTEESIVKEYIELKNKVIDYAAEIQRHKQLSIDENIQFYLNQDPNRMIRYAALDRVLYDEFQDKNPFNAGWQPGFVYPSSDFKAVHSYVNECQAYTGGKNVECADGTLTIYTKKEKCSAAAWHPKKGMIMQDFEYTSDAISRKDIEITEGSVVQVKTRCRGFLNHGIYLRSAHHTPLISIFNYTGLKMYCGVKNSEKDNEQLFELEGLQPIPYLIFTLYWGKDEIIWYVNNLEVHRVKNTIPKGEKLYLHMYSFQFKDKYTTEGKLEVDWAKIFKIKE